MKLLECFVFQQITVADYFIIQEFPRRSKNFMFCRPCVLVWSLQITKFTHNFFLHIGISVLGLFCTGWQCSSFFGTVGCFHLFMQVLLAV